DIDLMIVLEGEDPEIVEAAAKSLTDHLLKDPQLVSKAFWQPPGADSGEIDPLSYAELIAYGWMNAPPDTWTPMLDGLAPESSREALAEAFETLVYGIDPQESFRANKDPLGMIQALPGFEQLLASGEDKDQFRALDGKLRLVRVEAPNAISNYKVTIDWLAKVEPAILAWQASAPPEIQSLDLDWTGRAPYTAEIASAMESEMKLSVVFAVLLIHTLFFVFYRRFIPIIWLVLCLALTFTITLTIGSFIFEDLGATSVGFAAILIGLAVDYGFVIYQESLKHGSEPKSLRRKLAYSIGWAAVTTAAVFIGLRLSSLPGASQLGTMVGIGISVGALVMLTIFTWLNNLSPPKPKPPRQNWPDAPRFTRDVCIASGILFCIALIVLVLRGTPAISTSADDLRPKESHASRVFVEIWTKFGWGENGGIQVVFAGKDEAEVGERIEQAQRILNNDQSEIDREVVFPPSFLLANRTNQQANRDNVRAALTQRKRIVEEAPNIERPSNLNAGHVSEMLALSNAIFDAWERFIALPADDRITPSDATSRWALDSFVSRDAAPVCALGTIKLPLRSEATNAEELRLAEKLGSDGIYPAGWPLLRPAIVRIMSHEFYWVVIPMAAILLVMLWLAFRRLRRVALSVAALAFSFVALLSIMTLLGAQWNLMNLAAIPLLLGAGLDYSIHMQLALQRLNGDTAEARRTIGRALVLCGLSTATGFGTLIGSTNAGLASLGLVCTIGIIITMLTCVFILPAWYGWTHRKA
ncbi:MAG: hypothetical protein ACI9MB_004404, partial [Verrucomicrobiales bacterium]